MRGPGQCAFLIAFVVAGCASGPKVHTQPKAGTDFSKYKTFALLPLPAAAPVNDPDLMARLAEPARQTVMSTLAAKGLTQADTAQAELAVNLRGQSLPKIEVTQMGYHQTVLTRYGAVQVVHNPSTSVSTYDERTLTVELYDTKSKEMVWAGWSTTQASGAVNVDQVTNMIHHILVKFPAAAPKP